jgi:hypothetical protein
MFDGRASAGRRVPNSTAALHDNATWVQVVQGGGRLGPVTPDCPRPDRGPGTVGFGCYAGSSKTGRTSIVP